MLPNLPTNDQATPFSATGSLLLQTKLYAPRPHADTVPRPRLHALLDRVLDVPLAVVAAPAGFGKTTVVVQWLQSTVQPFAWLSLDAGDNDPITFLRYLVAALRTIVPQVGAAPMALLQAPQPPQPELIITLLLNDLATLVEPIVLVLDDYHVIHATPIHDVMRLLVERLPPPVHLVLTTREDPPLPLARLRATRNLVEVRASDLRFTLDEAVQFLREVMEFNISDEQVAVLEARTEGWITGLHLAALALQHRDNVEDFVQTFAGSNRFVVDYLIEQVVERLPAHLYRFLLQTSILHRFCASLCDAIVLGEAADPRETYSQVLINQIVRRNLFVIPLDDTGDWYRYHHLFGKVVHQHLLTGAANAEITTLHRRASLWYEQHNLFSEAMHHALQANDWTRATDLLEHNAEHLLKQGEHITLKRWLDAVPQDLVRVRPRLNVAYAAIFVWTHQLKAADQALEAAEHALADTVEPDAEAHAIVRAEITALRVTMTLHRSDLPRTIMLAKEALAGLPATHLLRSTMLEHIGVAYYQTMQLKAAYDAFGEAIQLSQDSGNLYTYLLAKLNQSFIHTERGALSQAAAAYRDTLEHVGERGVAHLPVVALAHHYLSEVLYEWNDLDSAQEHIQQSITLYEHGKNPRGLSRSYTNLARVHLARGERGKAREAVEQARHLADTHQVPILFRSLVIAAEVRLWLHEGDVRVARRSLPADVLPGDLPDYLREPEHLALARVLIAQGQPDEALHLLERLGEAARATGRVRMLISTLTLQAMARSLDTNQSAALTNLAEALTLAEAERYIRTFVDEGKPMRTLLHEAFAHHIHSAYCTRLLAAFPEDQTTIKTPEAQRWNASTLQRTNILPEPLNERELEVLRLIAEGHSNQQIADRLVVALSTVKWHINNLYGKLEVGTRTQALARAAELGLL